MSKDAEWNIEDYRDEHESEEHWDLRRAFIERWKDDYPIDRLLCLARIFTNIEFMGCRYPQETMQEIASLSEEVAKTYRSSKKNKLQRTFVSASDAAEDRAKGVKRKAGNIEDTTPKKINFVAQGHVFQATVDLTEDNNDSDIVILDGNEKTEVKDEEIAEKNDCEVGYDYMNEFNTLPCLDVRNFRENMLYNSFGRMIFMVRSWVPKLSNIQASCVACGIQSKSTFENGCMTLEINGRVAASATGSNKAEAKAIVETIAWNRLRSESVILLVKQQYIARDSERITGDSVGGKGHAAEQGLATPVESSVAAKMMKLMGWTGGGLGANEAGISEPIKPHLQQVHRAGLGNHSELASIHHLKRKVGDLMRSYRADDTLDYDLVFSADFSKEERSELHQVARRNGLNSKSYGTGNDRFLVVRKKIDPFAIVRAVIQNGGSTPKYQVFLPASIQQR